MDESSCRVCLELLMTFPFPVAVLDDTYRYVLLNPACHVDAVLARGRVGDTDLGGAAADPAARAQALERHAHYERSLLTQEPVAFEEKSTTGHGAERKSLWICVPVRLEGSARLLVAAVSGNLVAADRASEAGKDYVRRITREIQAPLTALIALAAMLANDLAGAQQARALLIEESGRLVLGQLKRLVDEAEPASGPRSTGGEG